MLSPVLLLLAQAAALPPPAGDIIVVGRRAEQELARCLARNCPPAEEVDASLEASVEQFADGRYTDARRTLQNAIRRNRSHAAQLPGPVSSLYATLATVAEHEGDARLWRTAARENVLVLRRHLGETNLATLREELSFADSLVGLGAPGAAGTAYRTIQERAVESGHPGVAAGAAFRRAWLALLRDRFKEAERFADEAVSLAGTDNRLMADLREILRTRIAIRRGDEGAVEALAARLRQSADAQPRLLFAPPVENINSSTMVELDPRHDSRIRFADVGYWIRADGRTAEVEVLRTSGLDQWRPGILRQVKERRYVPLDVEPGHPGIYRIDRFTVRGTIGVPTGTRLRQRMGNLTVHVVDLTETDAMREARRRQSEGSALEKGS
ncbi:hypothetical protein [Sphingomonas desiccabilis]|uniref:Tetratricopeptide repeat protein n=1 Tax=Sphingomonas desiccabilis TaxID=429134 RepID=A0A4Q2IY76_9SPHN|nr:hypothetical protein [Sphingomonas desiccabilis]MBB3909669.1 tetratricopeptide (TPR) repeat protein [Sphingomonas desiccabilis]RXZ34368.1 hypothetical protein EO081_01350 [Sphingomonas desiccabilis]